VHACFEAAHHACVSTFLLHFWVRFLLCTRVLEQRNLPVWAPSAALLCASIVVHAFFEAAQLASAGTFLLHFWVRLLLCTRVLKQCNVPVQEPSCCTFGCAPCFLSACLAVGVVKTYNILKVAQRVIAGTFLLHFWVRLLLCTPF
jgi:hypothetical protein